jgi:glycosyltransferase involved in cell wall biosynthesis
MADPSIIYNQMPGSFTSEFSIITPTCRRPELLRRSIQSVLNQTFTDFELIIVDDANDTETSELVKSFGDKRIIFSQHTKPLGAAGGYNSGIEIAGGKFILFLDDDDEYYPQMLEKVHEYFTKGGKDIGFIWTGILKVTDSVSGEKPLYSKIWPPHFSTKEQGLIAATTIGNGYGLCVRKECVEATGLYDVSLIMGQDADYLFRLVRNFEFETIPEVLVKIHQHEYSQLTNAGNNLKRLELREKILQKHSDLLLKYPGLYFIHYKHVVDLCYNLKLKKKGRKTLHSVIRNTPFRISNFTDLFFYEITGKGTSDFYYNSIFRRLFRFLNRELN